MNNPFFPNELEQTIRETIVSGKAQKKTQKPFICNKLNKIRHKGSMPCFFALRPSRQFAR
ncbi:MAG: hypothetical protein ACE5G9_08735 [Nitrospinales bacterium]